MPDSILLIPIAQLGQESQRSSGEVFPFSGCQERVLLLAMCSVEWGLNLQEREEQRKGGGMGREGRREGEKVREGSGRKKRG